MMTRIVSRLLGQGPRTPRREGAGRRYNWRPDRPDFRDIRFSAVGPEPQGLPPKVDLRPAMPPVVDQRDIGSCTANALAGALEYLELAELKRLEAQAPQEFDTKAFSPISRLFIYYNERSLEGTIGQDAGACIRDGVQSLNQVGACRESVWGYSRDNLFKRPAQEAFVEASSHRISQYLRLGTIGDMRQCLAQGFPFAFGFTVFNSFESAQVASSGVMPMPGPYDYSLGGHAVLAVGYDDQTNCVIVRNSWGTGWGAQGYFYMPYAYITNPGLSSDFWTIRR